jgi:hypothetical protein
VSARFKLYGADEIVERLRGMDHRLRQKTLREIGRDVARVVLPVMKQETRKGSGGLQKALGHKEKIYRRGAVLAVIVGPRTKVVFAQRSGEKARRLKAAEFTRDPRNRQWRWQKADGTKYYRPSRIAHLAGPRRESMALRRSVTRVKAPVLGVMRRHLRALTTATLQHA